MPNNWRGVGFVGELWTYFAKQIECGRRCSAYLARVFHILGNAPEIRRQETFRWAQQQGDGASYIVTGS